MTSSRTTLDFHENEAETVHKSTDDTVIVINEEVTKINDGDLADTGKESICNTIVVDNEGLTKSMDRDFWGQCYQLQTFCRDSLDPFVLRIKKIYIFPIL
jgi:hypothetical protein